MEVLTASKKEKDRKGGVSLYLFVEGRREGRSGWKGKEIQREWCTTWPSGGGRKGKRAPLIYCKEKRGKGEEGKRDEKGEGGGGRLKSPSSQKKGRGFPSFYPTPVKGEKRRRGNQTTG